VAERSRPESADAHNDVPVRQAKDLRRQTEKVLGDLAVTKESLATLIEALSAQAEDFADLLETMAVRGHAERRLSLARQERELAAIARRNAERLRQSDHGGTPFEHYPHLTAA
jgi:hypothetical protein